MFLFFKLIVIFFAVIVWYFYYGKCSSNLVDVRVNLYGTGSSASPPIEKLPMIKVMTQSLFIQFLLAFSECNSTCLQRQLAITYIDDEGAHALSI